MRTLIATAQSQPGITGCLNSASSVSCTYPPINTMRPAVNTVVPL